MVHSRRGGVEFLRLCLEKLAGRNESKSVFDQWNEILVDAGARFYYKVQSIKLKVEHFKILAKNFRLNELTDPITIEFILKGRQGARKGE